MSTDIGIVNHLMDQRECIILFCKLEITNTKTSSFYDNNLIIKIWHYTDWFSSRQSIDYFSGVIEWQQYAVLEDCLVNTESCHNPVKNWYNLPKDTIEPNLASQGRSLGIMTMPDDECEVQCRSSVSRPYIQVPVTAQHAIDHLFHFLLLLLIIIV